MSSKMHQLMLESIQIGEAHRSRLQWGPLLINGAAILGYANIVANTSDPDAALSMLLGPLWCTVIGVMFGAQAMGSLSDGHERAILRIQQATIFEEATVLLSNGGEEGASAATLRQALVRIRSAFQVVKDMPATNEEMIAELNGYMERIIESNKAHQLEDARRKRKTAKYLVLSVLLFVVSLLWVTIEHMLGQRLKPV